MESKWVHLKPKAIALRREGNSLGSIENILGIPRSTLSGWFRSISLTKGQQKELKRQSDQGLVKARIAAAQWHNAQKDIRLKEAARTGTTVLEQVRDDTISLELALAFLYLGEGAKTRDRTALGSSNSRIARFFVQCLQKIYDVPPESIKCYLHLRIDQDEETMKRYWSKELALPLINFGKSSFDKRTEGKPTYPDYKGVCLIGCGKVEIQRRLMYIANGFCDKSSKNFEAHTRG